MNWIIIIAILALMLILSILGFGIKFIIDYIKNKKSPQTIMYEDCDKNRRKKTLSIVLFVVALPFLMLIFFLATAAYDLSSDVLGNYIYDNIDFSSVNDLLNTDGESAHALEPSAEGLDFAINGDAYDVIGYSGNSAIVNIPAEINGLPVTGIREGSFVYCDSIKEIIVPESVVFIDYAAFGLCSSLEKVNLPDGITIISGCAFQDCVSLKEVTLPPNVTIIGFNAFYNCTSLATIDIPETVTNIEERAFSGCKSLESINVDDKNSFYCDVDGVLFDKQKDKLLNFPAGKKVTNYTIPDSVAEICQYAFSGCEQLSEISIPVCVTTIDLYAFENCTSLLNIRISAATTFVGSGAFSGCISLENIYVDSNNPAYCDVSGVLYSKSQTEILCMPAGRNILSYSIPINVNYIGGYAFDSCHKLNEIVLHNNITDINHNAFSNCISLSNIEIPDSVTYIGCSAFWNCEGLIKVKLPHGITHIENLLFYGCSSLTDIRIPSSVESIGNSAFARCTSLAYIELPKTLSTIGDVAFNGCTKLSGIIIPDSVSYIGGGAFQNCYITIYASHDAEYYSYTPEYGNSWVVE